MPGCPDARMPGSSYGRQSLTQFFLRKRNESTENLSNFQKKILRNPTQSPRRFASGGRPFDVTAVAGGPTARLLQVFPQVTASPLLTRGNTSHIILELRRTISQAISILIAIFERGLDNPPIYPKNKTTFYIEKSVNLNCSKHEF